MNNMINHTGYVDMFLDSTDEFEPYGFSMPFHVATADTGLSEANLILHLNSMCDDPWDD